MLADRLAHFKFKEVKFTEISDSERTLDWKRENSVVNFCPLPEILCDVCSTKNIIFNNFSEHVTDLLYKSLCVWDNVLKPADTAVVIECNRMICDLAFCLSR